MEKPYLCVHTGQTEPRKRKERHIFEDLMALFQREDVSVWLLSDRNRGDDFQALGLGVVTCEVCG